MFFGMARRTPFVFWKLSRSGSSSPQGLAQRARAFTAAVSDCGRATLVTSRDGVALASWVGLPPSGAADTAAVQLAHAVGARVDRDVVGPDLVAPVVGWLSAVQSSATRDSQVGVDPGEVSRRLAVAMRAGSWVGVSMRPPSRAEVRRGHRWYEHRLGVSMPTHHAWDDGAVVVSVFAGGRSAEDVRLLLGQVASVLPGFDVGTRPVVASAFRPVAAAGLVAGAVYGAAFAASGDPLFANAAGAVPALGAVALASGRVPTKATKLSDQVASGVLPRPPKRGTPPSAPRKENPNVAGPKGRASEGGYPLAPSSFLVGPTVTIGLVAPQAGAASGSTSTGSRAVPEALTRRIGPMVGEVVGSDSQVFLPAADSWGGVAMVGQPGSGKSQMLRSMWAWNCLERSAPAGEPGWPGRRNAMVAFESKGDGADAYRRWAQACGDKTLLVDLADPSSYGIDLFAVPGSVSERASWFTNALVYAFGDKAIQDRSFETIQAVMTAGLAVTPAVARRAELPADLSPLEYAYILLGGHGDAKGGKLSKAIFEVAVSDEREASSHMIGDGSDGPVSASTPLGVARERIAPLYGGDGVTVTDAQRRNLTEAPRNKLGQLLAAESWWSPKRKKVTWDQVLAKHRSIVVNTGVSLDGLLVDERLTGQMSALLMYGLKSAIQRNCSGWQSEGRSVTVFADELSLVAGAGPEVVTWLRNQGRSYGVRPVFATQYPEQLDVAVRTAFMSFGTLVAFSQQNTEIAERIAQDLSLGDDEWSGSDLKSLEPFHAAIRTSVAQHRQPTVPVRIPFFEAGLESDPAAAVAAFVSAQGR